MAATLAPERSVDPHVQLFPCPVRRRYAWQLARYGAPLSRWRRALRSGEDGTSRVRALLRVAEEETAYYPEAFHRAGVSWRDLRRAEDLVHFPTLSRATLQERFHELFARRVNGRDVNEGWLGKSSGSTGEPVRFFMDGESIHFFSAFLKFLWERLQLGPLPRPGSTGVVLLCTLPRSAVYETWLPLFRGTRFRKLHRAEPGAEATLQRLSPAVITGDPDSLARLVEMDVAVQPRLILSSAFSLSRDLADALTRKTGAQVVDYYSMAETGPLGWSCEPGSGRFHTLLPAAVLEESAGEIVVTNIRNRLFPLVRYRTGDAGAVRQGTCSCGESGTILDALSGRLASRFLTREGVLVDPSQLQALLCRLGVRQFQLVQRATGDVTLRHHGGPEPDVTEVRFALERLVGGPVTLSTEECAAPIFRPGEKPIVYRSEQISDADRL